MSAPVLFRTGKTMLKNAIVPLLVIAHILWGGGFIVLKIVMESLTIGQILLGRVLLASIVYALIWKRIPKPDYQAGDLKYLVIVALCEPFLLFVFETLGLSYTTASQAGMIVACVPLTVALGAFLLYRERVSRRCMAGIGFAVIGVVIVSAFGEAGGQSSRPLLGNFLMFCAVLAATGNALTIKHLSQRYSFMFLSAIQVFGATILFLPLAFTSPLPAEISWATIGGLIYLSLGITFCVYFIINYSLGQIKAAYVILFTNLIPISTLLLAFVILGERLSAVQYAGALLVIAGVVLAGAPESSSD